MVLIMSFSWIKYDENIKDIKPHTTSTYQSLIKCKQEFKAKYKVSPVIMSRPEIARHIKTYSG